MPPRVVPLPRSLVSLQRRPLPRQRPKPTGPGQDVTQAVIARDGAVCVPQVACGGRWVGRLVAHHRVNRGMGGSTAPWINLPANLLAACHDCNSALEDKACEEFYAKGWKVRRGRIPRRIPVLYPDLQWWFVDDAGERRLVLP